MNPIDTDAVRREALRQQLLLRTLMRDTPAAALAGWVRQGEARRERAVAAYRANASAGAERALASAYPTVLAMLGEESFAHLARAAWQRHPPSRGDLALWNGHLPELLEASEDLREWPYLGDAARLDWAVHCAGGAADAVCETHTLERLGLHEPEALRLLLQPAVAMLPSAYPIVAIWEAHHGEGDYAAVREALAARRGETALVHRAGWRVQVCALDTSERRFTEALLARAPLDTALQQAGPEFEFQPWLARALQLGWLWRVEAAAPDPQEENPR